MDHAKMDLISGGASPMALLDRDLSDDLSEEGSSLMGTSPLSPLDALISSLYLKSKADATTATTTKTPSSSSADAAPPQQQQAPQQQHEHHHFLTVSLQTLVGSSEMLGHGLENREAIASRQDGSLAAAIRGASATPLRDASQRPLFVIAPLDVLVTHEADGSNRFHIIEINGERMQGPLV